jgi:hypothetical protein
MNATVSNYEDIYEAHGIAHTFRPCFDALANEGVINNAQFGLRLATCVNYKACSAEIMGRLSQPYEHLFSGFQPARPVVSREPDQVRFVPHESDESDELTILPFPESL